jgi:hypothetical protein
MAIQFDLVCDFVGCPNPANSEVYPDSQSLLAARLANGWVSVQIQYDTGIKTWWLCPECTQEKNVADIIAQMKQ